MRFWRGTGWKEKWMGMGRHASKVRKTDKWGLMDGRQSMGRGRTVEMKDEQGLGKEHDGRTWI